MRSLAFSFGVVGVVALAQPVDAGSGTDLLGCNETVHDPDGVLDVDALNADITQTAAYLDADLRIRVEPTLDGGIDQRVDQLRRQCEGWDQGGQLADDLVVVMFSPTERENGVFYGDSSGTAPDIDWDAATDAMIPGLRSGDYTGAVDAALSEMRSAPSVSSSGSAADDDGGSNGGTVLVILALVVVGIVFVASKLRSMASGGGDGFFDTDGSDDGQGWLSDSSSRRRRSSFSFGSSRRSSSSSRSSSRSSGSRRRAGGGSKKW